jgi:hypothetical protein
MGTLKHALLLPMLALVVGMFPKASKSA